MTSVSCHYSVVISCIIHSAELFVCGYWHQRANERHGNPTLGNQELLMVKNRVGRPQASMGWASPWNVILFSFQCSENTCHTWALRRWRFTKRRYFECTYLYLCRWSCLVPGIGFAQLQTHETETKLLET